MLDYKEGGSRAIYSIDMTVSASHNDINLGVVFFVYLQREDVLSEKIHGCFLLYFL
jgi:hypothetical protein